MTDQTIELTRRRILGGVATIGAASAAVGAGTFAAFSDTETSSDNTIQAGSLEIQLNDESTWSFGLTNAVPGESTSAATLNIDAAGSITGDHVEIAVDVAENEETHPDGSDSADTLDGADGMSTLFEVTQLDYEHDDGTKNLLDESIVDDHNGNNIVDLDDVAQSGVFDGLQVPSSSENALTIEVSFIDIDDNGDYDGDIEDDNQYQGDELTVSIRAGLAQNSDQDVLEA